MDFLKLGKPAEAGWFDFTGAAAGRGQQREGGSNKGGKNTDHVKTGRKGLKKGFPAWTHAGNPEKSLGRSHVGGLFRGGSARAAGSGEKCGGGGDEGKFHDLNELVFIGRQHEMHAS